MFTENYLKLSEIQVQKLGTKIDYIFFSNFLDESDYFFFLFAFVFSQSFSKLKVFSEKK